MESNKGDILSKLKKYQISLTFFLFPICEVTEVSRLLHQPSHPNTTVSATGSPPKRVPIEASYLAPIKPPGMQPKPENQTDSKLWPFHPTNNPKSCQHKVLCINT